MSHDLAVGAEILGQLKTQGIHLRPGGNGIIRARPRDRLTDDIRELVRRHKPELLATLYGVTLTDIADRMGDDIAEVLADPALLEAVCISIRNRTMREQGIAPPDYTLAGTCHHCGPVWLPEGWPSGPGTPTCPWCFNRLQDRPIPRPGD